MISTCPNRIPGPFIYIYIFRDAIFCYYAVAIYDLTIIRRFESYRNRRSSSTSNHTISLRTCPETRIFFLSNFYILLDLYFTIHIKKTKNHYK